MYLVIVLATVQEKKRQRKLTPNTGQLTGRPLNAHPHRSTSIAPSGTACTHAATSTVGQATDVGQEESPLRASNHATGLVWLVCAPVKERHGSRGVLADVGECSMATGGVNCEGGQLAKKSLRGLTRRRRRRISRPNPRPPLSPVLQSKIVTPYDVHCASLWPTHSTTAACKGGPNVTCRKRRFGARRGRF